MKTVARIALAMTILLATVSTFANAQNSTSSSCASVSTGADATSVCAVQRKLDHINRQARKLQHQVKSLNGQQVQLGNELGGVKVKQDTDHDTLNKTTQSLDEQKSTLSAVKSQVETTTRTMNTMKVFIVTVVIILFGGAWWLSKIIRSLAKNQEVVIINPDVEYLRAMWKKSEGKKASDRIIHFTERLYAGDKAGHDLSGDVNGYTAIFEKEEDYPTIRHADGSVLKLKEVAHHAAKTLRREKAQTSSSL